LLAPVRYIARARARGMTMTTSKEQEATFRKRVVLQAETRPSNHLRRRTNRWAE
jgi:hypothetical protein